MFRTVATRAPLIIFCFALLAGANDTPPNPALTLDDCRIHAAPGYPGIKARCGVLERHLDPSDPTSTILKLSVAVVPALSLEPEPDAFVPIAGGPGAASTRMYAGYAQAFEKIRRDRDILLIDQRGTGESALMACELDDALLEGQLSLEETIEYTRSCLDSLPYDPRFFTTSVAVRDLEALRKALGYTELNLYGVSYGSRVAQHYARRYPDKTRSIILDGVVPPQLPLGPDIAIEAQKALQAILGRCASDTDCNDAFPDISADFAALRTSLRNEPQSISLLHPVTAEPRTILFGEMELAGTIRLMSYNPNNVSLLPLFIHEAANGNIAPLAATMLTVSEGLEELLAIGMHNAVVCTEDTPYYDDLDIVALAQTYIGPVMAESLVASCSVWPVGVMDEDLRSPLRIDVPVLLLSGTADPITPPHYAALAATHLGSARLLVGENQGHGLAGEGCVPRIIGRFVESASIDDLGEECMERLFAMPFFVDFAGPAP